MVMISVLMPVYKPQEAHLREAINSVLTQTYVDFEFLIVNDCPLDMASTQVILSYTDKRIRLLENDRNQGISNIRNYLCTQAQGKYLAIMDHDDICLPERFEKQVSFLEKNLDIGVLGCTALDIGKHKSLVYPQYHDDIEKNLFFRCCLLHPTSMIRHDVMKQHHIQYQEHYTPAEDYALWGDFIGKTKFHNLPDILFHYRQHEQNTSHQKADLMTRTTRMVQHRMRHLHPDKWQEIESESVKISRGYLFGKIPFLYIYETPQETSYKLFGFFSLWKNVRKYR